jgi:hypothetical protein
MPRIVFLPILAAALAITAIGSYSTLAGPGPIVDLVQNRDRSTQADSDHGGSQTLQSRQEEGPQDTDKVAQAIADEFGVSKEAVLARHAEGVGFGALFKLYKLARAQGITVEELLATIPFDANGERDFRFGELRKALTEEQRALYESGPKNLGKLVSAASKQTDKANTGGQDQSAEPGTSRGSGRIPPGQANKLDR